MTRLGRIIRRIGEFFQGLKKETKRMVPIAINVVEGLKKVIDSPADDVILTIVKGAIPGNADDILIDKVHSVVKEWLPKVLLELYKVDTIAQLTDQNDQLHAILAQFKLSSDESKNIFYHGLCSLILEKLADGKIDWSESILISEYYFINFQKNGTTPVTE